LQCKQTVSGALFFQEKRAAWKDTYFWLIIQRVEKNGCVANNLEQLLCVDLDTKMLANVTENKV
jgi:hypothetical protein